MASMEFHGLEEFQRDIKKVIEDYPDEADTCLRRAANGWKKDCNQKMPGYYKDGKRPIPKSWKTDYTQDLGVRVQAAIRNTAPHFHLVENGHREYDFHGNPTGGFVAGRHYAERTRKEWEDKFPQEVIATLNKLLKKRNL